MQTLKKNLTQKHNQQWLTTLALGLAAMLAVTGCKTEMPVPKDVAAQAAVVESNESVVLREGDVLKITFPGAPNLNVSQPIRRDGKIVLDLVGEVKAAGMTTAALQQDLVNRFSSQLNTKEVTVHLETSTFPVFVTGAVVHPGKIVSDHPITVLEAIMEAGGFDYAKADMKDVVVLRREGGTQKHYDLNLKRILEGKQTEMFYLRPSDIVYIREKFNWF